MNISKMEFTSICLVGGSGLFLMMQSYLLLFMVAQWIIGGYLFKGAFAALEYREFFRCIR